MFAFADDTIAAKTAAPIRVLRLRGYTDRFRSVSYAIRTRFAKNKIYLAAICENLSRGLYHSNRKPRAQLDPAEGLKHARKAREPDDNRDFSSKINRAKRATDAKPDPDI